MITAIAQVFVCGNCYASFLAPEVPELSYGLFVLRDENSNEAAYLDATEDAVFHECSFLVRQHPKSVSLSVDETRDLIQSVFSVTCDHGPGGSIYKINIAPQCPKCKAHKWGSYHPAMPIREWVLPIISHRVWQAMPRDQKKVVINDAIENYFDKQ